MGVGAAAAVPSDPRAVSKYWAGDPPPTNTPCRVETRIIRYASAKAWNNGKRYPTLPRIVPRIEKKTKLSAAKVRRA